MSLDETLVLHDGTMDKSFVTVGRNGRSTVRRSSHSSDTAPEIRTVTVSNQDTSSKSGKTYRTLGQVSKTKLQAVSNVPRNLIINVTANIPTEVTFTDAEVAAALLQAFHLVGGTALTLASATAQVARLRLGES